MLVAICADKDDVNGLVPKAFRDAEYLMIIEADTNMMVKVYPREDTENMGFARHVVEDQCEVIICGEILKEPFEIIAGAGVTRYDGSTKKVQRAYDYMKRGKLTVIRDHVGGSGVGHTHDYSCDCGEHGEEEEDRPPVFDAVISAAGLSSRMGDFKPLMEPGGVPNLIREAGTYLSAGIRRIVIVGGHRMSELEAAIEKVYPGREIRFVRNPDYASTGLLESVRIGLNTVMEAEEKPDGIFLGPVDVPLFTKFSLDTLMDWFSMSPEEVLIPTCDGKGGHPILIRCSCVGDLMRGDESRGLKSVLEQEAIHVRKVDVPDRGVILDADNPEEYRVLEQEVSLRQEPDEAMCLRILRWAGVEEDGLAHARAVAACAGELTEACKEYAASHNIELHPGRIRGAAMLHDVLKGMNRHEEMGRMMVQELGMEEIGTLVGMHNDLPEELQGEVNDALIVYLADKMVSGSERVSVTARFAEKEKQFAGNKAALAGLNRRRTMAEKALDTMRNAGWKGEM